MKFIQILIGLMLVMGIGVVSGRALSGRSGQATTMTAGGFPKDVYPETGNRLPPVKREDLDDTGKKLFDMRGPGGAFGPGGIRLYSTPVADYMNGVNDYLRRKSGLDPKLVELAILVTARELDCEYVWTAHEPQGLKAGLPQETVDIVKYRKPVSGLGDNETVIIQLGREAIGKHQVSPATAARAQNLFGNQGFVNIISLMGDYASTSILLSAFDQHVRPTDKPLLPVP